MLLISKTFYTVTENTIENIHHNSSYDFHLIDLSVCTVFIEMYAKIYLGLLAIVVKILLKNLIQTIIQNIVKIHTEVITKWKLSRQM
jgi:hypothetical protein